MVINTLSRRKTYVDDIVLPANVVQGNGVDIGIEEQSKIDHGEHVAHSLGADAERQDLDGVPDEQTRPGDIVESVVQENHSNDCASIALLLRGIVAFGANCPYDEAKRHASSGDKEERTTADLVNEEA